MVLMKNSLKPYFFIIIAGVLTGLIGVFVKLIGDQVHFMTLMFYRMFLALVLVGMVVPFLDKGTFKPSKRDLGHFFVVGLLMTITFTLFVLANLLAPVQNVVLITNFAPFLVLVLAYFFLKEKITSVKIVTLIIAIAGILILNPFRMNSIDSFGNYLALAQMVFYSFLIIAMRKENKEHSIGAVFWFFLFASLLLIPFPFIFGFGNLRGSALWYVLALGILSTGFAYLFHNLALERIGAEISSIFIMITMPLTGIIVAFFVLGEGFNLRVLLGGVVLIIAGVYLQAHNKKVRRAVEGFKDALGF